MVYEGIRIIDFTHQEQGPVATQFLGDFGAEVIKVERIDIGELSRRGASQAGGVSWTFLAFNRNKKSLTLDLGKPEAKEIVYRLVKVADVVVNNFRPGVMERLGFGYEDLHKINPRIICANGSAYGRTGPYRNKRGFDTTAQAMGGLMALTGEDDGPPTASGVMIVDFIGGMLLAHGIMLALAARERTGEGQVVDSCLLNAAIVSHLGSGTTYLNTGRLYPRPMRGVVQSAGRSAPSMGVYQSKDGKWLVVNAEFGDEPWKRTCTALGLDSSIANDPRFQTRAEQAKCAREIRAILEKAFAQKTREEALRLLDEQDIPCAPCYEYPELFSDPQVIHNQMVLETDHPELGTIKLVGIPVKLSKTPGGLRLPPPGVGQHNEQILSCLGYTQSEIQQLRDKGVVGSENVKAKAAASQVGRTDEERSAE